MSVYLDDPSGYHLEVSVLFENEEDAPTRDQKRGLTMGLPLEPGRRLGLPWSRRASRRKAHISKPSL